MAVEGPPLDFELLFRCAPSLLLVLAPSPGFRILAVSDAYLRATRSVRASIVGRDFFEAFPESAEGPRPTGSSSLQAALERVLEVRTADALNSPVFSPEGQLLYIIHRVDAMEVEVLRSARERDDAINKLRTANEELEAFVYSASHELRAPLRAIDAFCRLFKTMRGVTLDDGVRRLLVRIGTNVSRMDANIEDLLTLSRIAHARVVRERVDLGAMARRVVAGLRARDPKRSVTVEITAPLDTWADASLVAIALENVLGNAWKYTARREDARIEFGRRSVVGQSVFYVKDNGVGFDMNLADKLFSPFGRLHGEGEFEGHGIGLAKVRRIVERHGGEIWAEGRVDEGATFCFTLGSFPPA
jgi:signal transduction histidine kinase